MDKLTPFALALALLVAPFAACDDGGSGTSGGADTLADATSDAGGDTGSADVEDDDASPSALTALTCTTTTYEVAQNRFGWLLDLTSRPDGGWDVEAERLSVHGNALATERERNEDSIEGIAEGRADAEAVELTLDEGVLTLARPEGSPEGLWVGEATLGEDEPITAACWTDGFEPAFRYDPDTGDCVDEGGARGMNSLPIMYVRETALGECADLRGVPLHEEDLGYPQLEGWNLKGADLREATLFFADLVDADLRGADLTDIEFGYAWIKGTVDEHTQPQPLPAEEDGRIAWRQ